MRKKTPVEMERARMLKAMRTLVRLKHALAADEELNDVLPEAVDGFNAAVKAGTLPQLQASLSDALGGDSALSVEV